MKPVLPTPCLMLVTEPHPDLVDIVRAAIAGGVNVVQLRDKTNKRYDIIASVQELRPIIPWPNLLILNNTMIGVAKGLADGGHNVGYSSFTNTLDPTYGLIGTSIHSRDEAEEAAYGGADYIVAGTVFASQSHPNIAPQGVNYLRDVCRAVPIPVIAIGGITPERLADCIDAGAAGVAVLSPIMRAQDPEAVARNYRTALDAAWANKAPRSNSQ